MSWDILPKSNLQYFLQKLKAKFDGKADNSDVTETDTPNSTPFLYRETPYEADRVFLDELVGGSVAWNQLVPNNDKSKSVTIGSYNYADIEVINNNISTPHFLFAKMSAKVNSGTAHFNVIGKDENDNLVDIGCVTTITTTAQYVYILCKLKDYMADYGVILRAYGTEGQVYSFDNLNVIDLTQMFGSTIADYVYSLEQVTAGSGIAWLKSHGFFTKDYYPYNAGELISVKTSGKKYVGKNKVSISDKTLTQEGYVFNESVSFPSGIYTFSFETTANVELSFAAVGNGKTYVNGGVTKDGNRCYKLFTATDALENIRLYSSGAGTFTKFQLEIAPTGGYPSEYEPYTETTYDISNIDLRGIPKLVSNELVYDGDTYESDGDVTRKYGVVDLGTLNWDSGELGTGLSGKYTDNLASVLKTVQYGQVPNIIAEKYVTTSATATGYKNGGISYGANRRLWVFIDEIPSGYLIYELATPTTETTEPFTNPQICDKDGTEEFIDNRTVPVPVGHNSTYANLPSMMDGDYLSYMARNFASEKYVDTELGTKVDKVTGKGLSTNDYTNEEKALVETIPDKADVDDVKGTQTVTGNPIALTDASETYAQGLSVELAPKQDLHGYDYPWVGGAGKNKISPTFSDWSVDGSYLYMKINGFDGGTYNMSFVDKDTSVDISRYYIGFMLDYPPHSQDYRWVINNGAVQTTKNNVSIKEGGAKCDTLVIYPNTQEVFNKIFARYYVQVEQGSSATSFEPYENICPITGYTEVGVEDVGKNLFDLKGWLDTLGALYTQNGDEFTITAQDNLYTSPFVFSETDTQVTFSFSSYANVTTTVARASLLDANGNVIGTIRAGETGPLTGIASKIRFDWSTGGTFTINKAQIELGSTATTYEPYASTSATIQFGQTVYGGESDFVEGGTDDKWAKYDTWDTSWYKSSTEATILLKSFSYKKSGVNEIKCNSYKYEANQGFNLSYGAISNSGVADYRQAVFIRDSRFAGKTVAECVAILNDEGTYFVYQLETPNELSTPATDLKLLQDTNNLTTNGTTITLDYIPNNSIGDAVKASEEYTDRAVETKGGVQKTVIFDDLVRIADEITLSLPSSYNFLVFEVNYMYDGATGSAIYSSLIDSINIPANYSGTSHWMELRRAGDIVSVRGDTDIDQGGALLKITAF